MAYDERPNIAFSDIPPHALAKIGLRGDLFRKKQRFGDMFSFEPPIVLNGYVPAPERRLEVGAFSYFWGQRLRAVTIGRYCSIAPNVIIGEPEHPIERLTSSVISYAGNFSGFRDFCEAQTGKKSRMKPKPHHERMKQTVIGHDVWIGEGAFIKTGVTIGTGSIIAAGSVVVKDVAPYSIAGGIPAKLIRPRFAPDIIAMLMASEWWRYSVYHFMEDADEAPAQAIDRLSQLISRGEIEEYNPTPITFRNIENLTST